jgi:hypothetical protein
MGKSVSEQLHRVLKKIDRPGSFCVSGGGPAPLPGLVVEGLDPIGLPLTAAQAKELKTHCQQAPYGKGELTIVDTNVRQVWQLTPRQFTITNPDWTQFLAETTRTIERELGLEGQKLECHLYNLLFYEPGNFFLPHRDGEKLDRMVATLVVVLPSVFQGGELVVRHEGQEKVVDFGTPQRNPFHVQFAAFYADCEHEVRPLREGYRLCLIYNLTLTKSKKTITAPRTTESIDEVAKILRSWSETDPSKLAIPLEHQYTQDGLVWDTLKGVDRVKARVISEAAGQAGCNAFLALLTFEESGSAEQVGGFGRSRRRYYDDDDEEDEDDADDGEYDMIEVFDSSLTAEHWSDADGNRPRLGKMEVEPEQIVPPEALTEGKPEQDVEGYTGNEGLTLTRWYRHAAIFLWPESHHFNVLCDCGLQGASTALKALVAQWEKAGQTDADGLKARCTEFAAIIINRWSKSPGDRAPEAGVALSASLAKLDDPALIRTFLTQVVARDPSVEPDKTLAKTFEQHGWKSFQNELMPIFENTTVDSLERNVQFLEHLSEAKPRQKADWLALCHLFAQKVVSALERIDREGTSSDWQLRDARAKLLAGLARSFISIEQFGLLSQVMVHALDTPFTYPLITHIEALTSLKPWLKTHVKKRCDVMLQWFRVCCERLELLTEKEPTAPTDFARDADVSCKCADCAELKQFLKNPLEKVHRFRMSQDRRSHLEQIVRTDKCDVVHTTERIGSPHTLVCTKTTASFEARLKKYHENLKHLATLRSIEADLPD